MIQVDKGWSQHIADDPLVTEVSERGSEAEKSTPIGDVPQRHLSKDHVQTDSSRANVVRAGADNYDLDGASEKVLVKGKSRRRRPVERGRSQLRDQLEASGAWGIMSGGEGSRLEVQVRGSGGHQSGLYLDEVPLHSLRGQAVDLSLFSLDLLEAVEVSHGGDGALNGSGEQGGRVRLLTPEIPTGQRSRWSFGGSTQGWGRVGALWGRGQPNHRGENSGGLLSFSLSGGPNAFAYRDTQGVHRRRARSQFNRLSFLSKGQMTYHQHRLRLSAGAGDLSRGEPGPEGLTLPGRESRQNMWWISASDLWSRALKKSLIKLQLNLNYLRLNYLFQEQVPLWQSQAQSEFTFLDQRLGLSARLSWIVSRFTLGVRAQMSVTRAMTQEESAGREQAAITPHVELRITPKLKLSWATRLDLNTERSSRFVSHTKLAWRSALRTPWELWLAWSQVWRDPGFDERFLSGPGIVANPRLLAEEGQWGELGISKKTRGSFSYARWRGLISLRAFGQEYDQLITYVPLDPYRIRAENLRGAEVLGVESTINAALSVAQYSLSVLSELSALRHRTIHEPRAPLPLRPQFFTYARIKLTERLSTGEVGAWVKVNGRGAVTVDRFGERSLPSRRLWGVGLRRRWVTQSAQWTVDLSLENLLNTSSYDFALHPIAGRSIWISFELE